MVLALDQLINGLAYVGPILLMAVSLTTVLAAVRVLNVALGATFALTAVLAILSIDKFGGWAFFVTCLVVPPVIFVALERVVLAPQRGRVADLEMGSFAVTLGISIILTAIAAIITQSTIWALPPKYLRFDVVWTVRGVQFPAMSVLLFAAAGVVAAAWGLVVRYTTIGKLFRAVATSRYLATAVGVETEKIAMTSWAISGLLTGIATILLVLQSRAVGPDSGAQYLLTPFAAVIAGGMGSLRGAVIASFFFGLAESLIALVTPLPGVQQVIVFALLFVVLLVRPQGIAGASFVRREF